MSDLKMTRDVSATQDAVGSSEWVEELEAVLCKVTESEGCFLTGRNERGLKLIAEAKEWLEQHVDTWPRRSSTDGDMR